MEEELTEEVEMAKRRIDEINMELNQVGAVVHTHTLSRIIAYSDVIIVMCFSPRSWSSWAMPGSTGRRTVDSNGRLKSWRASNDCTLAQW